MATLGSLTLKIRSTRKLLALDLLQSQQEIERFRETANNLLTLKTGVSIDWDSFSKAESEIRRWVDSLPKTDLQVTASFKDADLTQSIKDLERLLANPLKIQVDDTRLFELNEHFKLKERDYRHLQSVLDSPLAIKVDRTQLDNLSRDLQAIENTPKINLQANVDLTSVQRFHEQLNRYTQGRTLELATSVSRTTLNALQHDLKGLASNLTTARVSVQIDSQLQALRRELAGLPDTRVQVGVDVDDLQLLDLEQRLDLLTKPHKLRLDLPDTIGNIGSEIKKLVFSPITIPVKLAQNIVGSTFTGMFEGVGRELSRNFSKGFSSSIEGFITKKTGMSPTDMGEKSGKYVAKNTYLWGEYAARSQGYQKGLRGVGEDVMKVGESIDQVVNPRKFRRNVRKAEDTYVAYQEKVNQGDLAGAESILKAAYQPAIDTAQTIGKRVAGVALRSAAQPYRIRKRVRLAQSIEEANEQAKTLEIPHYDRAQADASESVNLVMGGIDFNGTRNTDFASRLMRQVMPKGYTVPLTTPFSNTPVEKSDGLVDKAMHSLLAKMAGGDEDAAGKMPVAKLLEIAVSKGYNPDAIRGYAHVKKIREMHPDKPINVMGTSGGSAVAEEIISMAERDGDKNVRGLGIGLPFHGLTRTAGKQFMGTIGGLDPLGLAAYGTMYAGRNISNEDMAKLPFTGSGLLAPDRQISTIIPGAGQGHNIGLFSTNQGFQNVASKQLNAFINPDMQGRQGSVNLNPYVQFGHMDQDLNIPRTLKAMYGDRQAKKDIVVGGEYSFYHPAHPDWRRDQSDFAAMKSETQAKFKSVKGLPKEHADEYIGFLDTMQSDLTAFYESKGKIKPAKSLEQAAKYYPELREFATQKGVGNGKFEDAFQYREQPQKVSKPTETTAPISVEPITYNPFADAAAEVQRRRQERESRGLNDFLGAANPWDNRPKQADIFDPSKHTPLRLDSKPKQDVADRSLEQAIARFDGAVTRFEQAVNKPSGKVTRQKQQPDIIEGEYVEIGADRQHPALNAGKHLLNEVSKPIGEGYSVLKAVEKTVLDLTPGGHTAKGIIQKGVVPMALGGIAMQSPVLGSAIHAAGNATHLLAQAPIDTIAGMAGDGMQGLLSGVARLPGGAGLVADIASKFQGLVSGSGAMATGAIGSVALPWLSGRMGMGLAGKATNALLPHLNDDHPLLSAGTERLALTAGAAVKKFIPQTTLEPYQDLPALPPSKLASTKDGINHINESLEKTKSQIELAIKNGEVALAKKYTAKLEKDIAESSRLIQSIASNPNTDSQSAQQLKSTVAGHLKQKSKFVNNAYQAIDLMQDGATLADVKQQPGWSQKLKNIVVKGIRQNMGNNEAGYINLGASIPALDFLDHPVKSFKETIGLKHRESAYNQGTMLGGDGTTRYTPPPTRLQSLISNAKDSVDSHSERLRQRFKQAVGLNKSPIQDPPPSFEELRPLGKPIAGFRVPLGRPLPPPNYQQLTNPKEQPPEQPTSLIDRLKANATKIFTNTYDNATTSVKSGIDRLKGLGTPLNEDTNALESLGNAAKNVVKGFAAFAGIAFVGGIISKIGVEAILAAASFQDLKLAVGAATSSKITADKLISRSTTQANQLGYNYQNAIQSDASFAAATKGTALELVSGNISRSLRQYNRVLGVSEERQKLSQIAVQQMAGKGTLAAEEVFGQLAESSPGAVNVLARSQGLTIGQLRARMQEGGLNSADTLSRFGMQLDAESVNSVDGASKSTSATIGKVQNSILALQTSVGGQLLAPATVGLNTFNDAIKFTESNIDSIAKAGLAGFLVLGAGAVSLAAKLLSFKSGFDTVGAGISALSPHMLKFGLQAAAAYVAIETLSGIWGSFQNTSPLKGISDELDVMLAKLKENGAEVTKTLAKLREEKFSKNLSTFEQLGDIAGRGLRFIGSKGQLNSERRADEDGTTAIDIINKTRKNVAANPDLKIAATQGERENLVLELSMLRARRATLTSRDRDELQSNASREQVVIKRQAELDAPITERQAELEQDIKANRAISEDPAGQPLDRALATQVIKQAEEKQRLLQSELSRSSDKVADLANGLRKLTFESSSALRSIEQNSQLKSTQSYQSAILDPQNTGGLQGSQAQIEIEKISARRDVKQQDVNNLRGKLSENADLLAKGNINPDTTSKEQLEYFKTNNQDASSQQIIAYIQQYQQAKQELIDSNQSLFQAQYNYLKSIADYNKGSIDQVISLSNRLANLSLTARNAIASLQQQVEQTLVEIDTTSSKAVFQAQRNQIQGAYNKFLEKLGISTDDIFEQIFTNYNSILDTVQQLVERRLGRQSSAITANYRQVGNETRKYQTQTEQTQGLQKIKRQEAERKLGNPLNQLGSGANQPVNTNPSSGNTNLVKPIASSTVSSGYEMRTHPITGEKKFHAGTDYPVPVGTPIKAAGEGVVTFAGTKGGYGYTVDLKHASGETTRYAHLSQIGVEVGRPVKQGQTIAFSGGAKGALGSGRSTGPHLHFETHNTKGEPVDPVARLKQNNGMVAPVKAKAAQHDEHSDRLETAARTLDPATSAALTVIARGEVRDYQGRSGYFERQEGGHFSEAEAMRGFPNVSKGENIGRYQFNRGDYDAARKIDPRITNFSPENQDRIAIAKLYSMNRGGKELDRLKQSGSQQDFDAFIRQASNEWESLRPKFIAKQGQSNSSLYNLYLKNSQASRSSSTAEPQSANPQPVGKGTLGKAILNNVYQQGVDQQVQGNVKLSNQYVGGIKKLSNQDTDLSKKKQAQETNLYNQQDNADRTKLDTQILQHQNQLNRNLPAFNRKSTELENQAAAYNRSSNNRDPYKKIDDTYRQYGGIPDTATQDTAVTNSQSSIERLKEESRSRRENLLKQIQSIEAQGAGWANSKKTIQGQIQSLKKNGFTEDATALEDFVSNNDKAIGTPKARQKTIDRLSRQYRDLPSDGIAVADAIAPGTSKVLTNIQGLTNQYLPKTFQGNLDAEARSIIERFKSLKEELQSQLEQVDGTIKILESEIQTKLKAAGYAPQKLDLTDPERLNLLRKVAPEETAVLEQTTAKRKQLNLSGQNIDRNASTAAARSVSIGQKREQLQIDRLGTDYLAATQDGFIGQIQVDKQRFTQGKTELDLQFEQGAISADLYTAKLKQLGVETNTLRNAIQPLRGATTGFFDDIFKGQGVFDGLGNALRNLTINILKNFQDIISKQLGQQLFGSLAAGAETVQGNSAAGGGGLLGGLLRGIGLVTPGSKPNTTAGIDLPVVSENSPNFIGPVLPPVSKSQSQGTSGGSLAGLGFNLGLGLLGLASIPGFATGGMVTSPTLALVGEGINNEAIVPLPNGRSIPVDLKGAGESGGGNVSSSVSVTIQNSGQARETSRGEGQAISQMIKGAVMDVLINERRAGGLLN